MLGSFDPNLAATVISFESLEKILDRCLSTLPFLCLIPAQCECPAINYNILVYEGFGPEKIAIIVEALTDNKNRTVTNIRKIFQKYGGSLGESGTVSHQFNQRGIIRIDKKKISDNDILDLAINSGAEDCTSENLFHEIITTKENFNKVRLNIEKKIKDFISSGIEWMPINKVSLDEEKTKSVLNFLTMLEDDDDVQHVYANLEVDSPKLEKALTA